MIHLVWASCLWHLIQHLKYRKGKQKIQKISTAIRGLSVNPNTKKTVLLKYKLVLRYKKLLVIWHDVINKSISEHKSNWCPINECYNPMKTTQIIDTIKSIKWFWSSRSHCLHEKARHSWPVSRVTKNRYSRSWNWKYLYTKAATRREAAVRAIASSSGVKHRTPDS